MTTAKLAQRDPGPDPVAEQDAVGAWILAELESERPWDELFARSSDLLAELAAEAIREDEAGLTEPSIRRSFGVANELGVPQTLSRSAAERA